MLAYSEVNFFTPVFVIPRVFLLGLASSAGDDGGAVVENQEVSD
jgi:hypothetical protein